MDEQQTAEQDRQAQDPTDISSEGWRDVAKQTWTESGEDNLGLIASGIAFNAFLALFPLLMAVVLGYGIVASPQQVAQHISTLADVMPEQAAELVGSQLQNMVQSAGSATGLGLVLTLAIAIYGAMRGASGIITGLNIVYDIEETRSFIWQTATALVITLGLILVFMVASLAISLMSMIESLLPDLGGVGHTALKIAFWIGSAAAVSAVIAMIYAHAPSRDDPKWVWLTPGSIIATIIWVAATFAFSFYVSNFGNYNATYGALGAVIVFLTWLYLSSYILLLGAELNQVLERRAGHDEQIGQEKSGTPAQGKASAEPDGKSS